MAFRPSHFPPRRVLLSRRSLLFGLLFWAGSVVFFMIFFSREVKLPPCPRSVLTMVDMNLGLTEDLWGYSTLWALRHLNMTSQEVLVPYQVLYNLHKFFKPLSLQTLDVLPHRCFLNLKDIKIIHPPSLPHETGSQSVMVDFNSNPAGFAKPVVYAKSFLSSEFLFLDDLLLHAELLIRNGLKVMNRIRRPAKMVVGVWVSKSSTKPPLDFYTNAMFTFRGMGRTLFVVVGDIDWAEEHMNSADVILSTPGNIGFDMAVLSLCNHTILDFGDLAIWVGLRSPGFKYIYSLRTSLFNVLEKYSDWFIYIESPLTLQNKSKALSEGLDQQPLFTPEGFQGK